MELCIYVLCIYVYAYMHKSRTIYINIDVYVFICDSLIYIKKTQTNNKFIRKIQNKFYYKHIFSFIFQWLFPISCVMNVFSHNFHFLNNEKSIHVYIMHITIDNTFLCTNINTCLYWE